MSRIDGSHQAVKLAPSTRDCANNGECQLANGIWLQVTVPVATTYAPTAPNDWWKVNYNLSGCTSSPCGHAIVTWGIASGSAPVHLIKQY